VAYNVNRHQIEITNSQAAAIQETVKINVM